MALLPTIIPIHPAAAYIGNTVPPGRKCAQRELRQEEVFRRNSFDLYFSKNNVRAFGWYTRDAAAAVPAADVDNIGAWRAWNYELRIHTYAVMSDHESGQRWLRRDAGKRSRVAVSNTNYLLRQRLFAAVLTDAQTKALINGKVHDIRSMHSASVQALQTLESEELEARLNLYLQWNAAEFAPPLTSVVEEFEDLTGLIADQSILAQPLTLDWVIRKLTGPNADPTPIAHIECQYWIDTTPSILVAPTLIKINLLLDELQIFKLHVGGMQYVPGILRGHHCHLSVGERYRVLDRETFWAQLSAPGATPMMLALPTILTQLFSRVMGAQNLEEFELTANKSLPYWETFWSPPGFVAPIQSPANVLTFLKLSCFTFRNLQHLHDFIARTDRTLTTCHLSNLRGSHYGELNAAGVNPWAAILQLFDQSAVVPGGPIPFPNLEELNVENIEEERYYPGPGPIAGPAGPMFNYWTKWDATAIQENPFTAAGSLVAFPATCEIIHLLLRVGVRPLTATGGIIPAVAGVTHVRQVPFFNVGPAPVIITTRVQGVAPEPARPRYWFH